MKNVFVVLKKFKIECMRISLRSEPENIPVLNVFKFQFRIFISTNGKCNEYDIAPDPMISFCVLTTMTSHLLRTHWVEMATWISVRTLGCRRPPRSIRQLPGRHLSIDGTASSAPADTTLTSRWPLSTLNGTVLIADGTSDGETTLPTSGPRPGSSSSLDPTMKPHLPPKSSPTWRYGRWCRYSRAIIICKQCLAVKVSLLKKSLGNCFWTTESTILYQHVCGIRPAE